MPVDNPYLRRTRTPTHGQQAEKRAARRLGGRQTPASGALEGAKGDIRRGKFLLESKATRKRSMSVQLAWLEKISKEALDAGLDPGVVLQFVDSTGRSYPAGRWVLVPERVFEELTA